MKWQKGWRMSRPIYSGAELIPQPFHHFTCVIAHSPTLLSLYLRYSPFDNLSITSPTSQLIFQPFCRFTYVTAHSPTFPSLHLRHSSFSNPSVALPTSQLILQLFRHLTYVTAHSPTLPSLYVRHSSFSNPSVALPTSQLILQPFRHFTYVTSHSPTLPSLYLRHSYSEILPLLHLRHSSFSNPWFASPTSQALHLIHLASRPWVEPRIVKAHKHKSIILTSAALCNSWSFIHISLCLQGRPTTLRLLFFFIYSHQLTNTCQHANGQTSVWLRTNIFFSKWTGCVLFLGNMQ